VQVPRCIWQSKALDEAPYKFSGAVTKLASITFWSLAFSWTDKPWFLTEGKLAAVLIKPSSWGCQLDGDVHHQHVHNKAIGNKSLDHLDTINLYSNPMACMQF
jgi:hypothetical protein